MSEKENSKVPEEEYITEKEAKTFFSMFRKYWKEYKQKDPAMTNQEWLEQLLRREIPEMSEEEVKENAAEMVDSVQTFDENMTSIHEAAQHGTSKEHWLGKKLEEVPAGMSAQAYGAQLQEFDDLLAQANEELADAVTRSADGHIKMSQNLDGNLAEEMLAKTLEADAALQGKHIKVEVLNSHNKNSVDVRVKDLETGKGQNYQMKFGKDAKATIALIERGDYRNQRIIVPKEQVKEVTEHFRAKGSEKTITDHIDAFGAKGKSFAKQEMKELQQKLQENGEVPQLSYDDVSVKTLASNIGKNAGKFAIISAAVTTGINVIKKAWKGEKIEADEVMEEALKSGADAGVKTVAAGTLKVAVEKGVLRCIPKGTPAGVIATIATVGVENVKILAKAAKGEIPKEKVLEQIGRTTVSMTAGLIGAAKGAAIGAVVGGPVGAGIGLVTGAVGYTVGSKFGEAIYDTAKKAAKTAKTWVNNVAKKAKKVGEFIRNTVRPRVRLPIVWLTV